VEDPVAPKEELCGRRGALIAMRFDFMKMAAECYGEMNNIKRED
jgi:hypothetical protein